MLALTTHTRVHRVWTNSTINQIGFLFFCFCDTQQLKHKQCLATQQIRGNGNKSSTIMLVMIRTHTIGFSYVVWPNNTTQLIKLLQQQSFTTSLNEMIFCHLTIFVLFADPAMNFFPLCLIDASIENKNKHHVHYPRFGLYTFWQLGKRNSILI